MGQELVNAQDRQKTHQVGNKPFVSKCVILLTIFGYLS